MHRLAFVAAALALAACTVTSSPSSPPSSSSCPDAGPPPVELDAAPAADASPDVDAEPCALRVDSLVPTVVPTAGGVLVTMSGCGFLGVRDVEVNVQSVPFSIVDDHTIVFRAWVPDEGTVFPFSAEIDIIRKQPDQVQTWLVYQDL